MPVALRKESVDRNDNGNAVAVSDLESLSARRAWIEIIFFLPPVLISLSLSARRAWIEIGNNLSMLYNAVSRSPQGERG